MTSRERVTTVLSGDIPDRVPLSDSYWETTIDRWRREGLPEDVEPNKYFGTDEIVFIAGDYTMQFPKRVISDLEATRVYWDADGALKRDLHAPDGWTSQWLDFTVKTHDDWARHKSRMEYNDSRIPAASIDAFNTANRDGKFVCYSAHACFHSTWMKTGMENELMSMLTDKDFIHEIFDAHTSLVIRIFEGFLSRGVRFDGVRLADDLGYKSSTLISPELYRELVYPYHRKLCAYFSERGLPTLLHSDGDISALIPHFIDAGFCGLHPLEVKAGLDMRELRSRYGSDLILFGNIDARSFAGSPEEIEHEISTKLAIARETGGYIYHSDHSVPNNVSLSNYRLAMSLVARYGSYDK